MEEVMDYLVENTSGEINNRVHDLINAYLRLEEKLEDKERELEDLKNDYDMIILDIMLPGADGFEICKQIRAV